MGDILEAWVAAVGPEIARNAWPARFQRDGTLIVHTQDAIWSFELGQRAAEITTRLPRKPALKFVPGPLPEPGADAAHGPHRGRRPLPWSSTSWLPAGPPQSTTRSSETSSRGPRRSPSRGTRASRSF